MERLPLRVSPAPRMPTTPTGTLARREKHGMNEEGKELTVEFLMNQLAIEDCNAHDKSLSQLDSTTSVNFAGYDCRQNRGKSNKQK